MKHRESGFTIVEMIVVVVVIAILAIITATIYTNVQSQARNHQVADAADKVADAIQLFISKNGHFPKGGWSSSTPISGTECSNGQNGWFATKTYGTSGCTVEDTLIASGYLPNNFSSNFPDIKAVPAQDLMVYTHGNDGAAVPTYYAMVYYAMEDPTTADTANWQAQLNKCGITTTTTATSQYGNGMRNGICIQYSL